MSRLRGLVAVAAAMGGLVAASPASAIEISLRPPFLPPIDGSARASAFSLASEAVELIVAVRHDARAQAILRAHGARRLDEGIWLVGGTQTAAVVRRLDAIGALRYAHRNGRIRPASVGSSLGDPADPTPWWLPQIGADQLTPPAAGFPLTIVDDGIDVTHEEFRGRQITFLNAHDLIDQEDYHGTMMSSVAVAPANGVGIVGLYPRANLRLADTHGGTCADVLAALGAAASASASVINMSWGFSPPLCLAMYDQILRALANGSLSVSANGNLRLHLSPPGVPAMWPHVMTVGSTGLAGRVSYFSNSGGGIDLSAPGESIIAATPPYFDDTGYMDLEGTSFSSVLVSAAGAWIATRRQLHVTQLFELLRSSARDVGMPGWDRDTGYGILNLAAALRRPLPAVDPLEPNDDVNQVSAGGVFKDAAPALTRPGTERATLRARLDRSEDPVDVYRVYVPARQAVRLHVAPTSNIDLELFRPGARSCYYQSRRRALQANLIGGSYRPGNGAESFMLRRAQRSRYVFACVYKPRGPQQAASYSLTITTGKAGQTATNR